MAWGWNHLKVSSLTCLAPGLGWLEGCRQLKMSNRAPMYGFSVWLGFSQHSSWFPHGNLAVKQMETVCPFLTWSSFRSHEVVTFIAFYWHEWLTEAIPHPREGISCHLFFFLFIATLAAYGSSWARGWIRASAAGLCCSLQQCWILNPLSEARGQTCILIDTMSCS